MRIDKITTYSTKSVTLVQITDDAGHVGWGQTAPFNADITATVLHRLLAPVVLGIADPTPDSLSERVISAALKFPGSFVLRGLCGVETALWDLLARLEGKLVCEMLGASPGDIPAYASSMRRDITPADEVLRLQRARDDRGFQACKIRVGAGEGEDRDAWPGRTEELLRSVRTALGPEYTIHADANSAYTPARAIEIGKVLMEGGPGHFEEPCPYWEMEWTREVNRALDGPVAGGEQDNWIPVWERMIAERVVDIVQPDVCYIGGISRALRVARMAHNAGMLCTPHSANLSMVTLFTLHLVRALPNAGPYLEFSIEDQGELGELFEPALVVRDGKAAMPQEEAGWGVRVRQQWIDAAKEQTSRKEKAAG